MRRLTALTAKNAFPLDHHEPIVLSIKINVSFRVNKWQSEKHVLFFLSFLKEALKYRIRLTGIAVHSEYAPFLLLFLFFYGFIFLSAMKAAFVFLSMAETYFI